VLRGDADGRLVVVVGNVGIGAGLEQLDQEVDRGVLGRDVQRSLALLVRLVELGLVRREQLNNLEGALGDGVVERGLLG